jgi:hypothetical protein
MAYSIKSWPDSSCKSAASSVFMVFLFLLLKLMGMKPAPDVDKSSDTSYYEQ